MLILGCSLFLIGFPGGNCANESARVPVLNSVDQESAVDRSFCGEQAGRCEDRKFGEFRTRQHKALQNGGPTRIPFRCFASEATSFVHLARVGRLAWASSAQLLMLEKHNMVPPLLPDGKYVPLSPWPTVRIPRAMSPSAMRSCRMAPRWNYIGTQEKESKCQ